MKESPSGELTMQTHQDMHPHDRGQFNTFCDF